MNTNYKDFLMEFSEKIQQNNNNLLSNIFTMRIIGNKTHGDMAEIAIPEFINEYMPTYSSLHVGKERFRQKEHEEDIVVLNNNTNEELNISIKAYGVGPLQLSTDKDYTLFPLLEKYNKIIIDKKEELDEIINSEEFQNIFNINVLPLIYDEDNKQASIMVFDYINMKKHLTKIEKILPSGRRKHPIYVFYDENNDYMCEVRYGGKDANALQRGLWTHTVKAYKYFIIPTNGWVKYEIRKNLINLFSIIMVQNNDIITKLEKELLGDNNGV